ncbi:MAG: aminotransferase A [uncultured bacterium]|nr:MAG: aminotransferase A [uncultured bacterium]
MKFSQRSNYLTSSPLYIFAKKVKELELKGGKIISLGLGEPYNDTPENIKKAGIEAIKANKTHYNPAAGSLELRKALGERHGVSSDRVLVSSGAKPFLGSILWSLIDSGDVLYMAEPFYPPFLQIAQSCGAKVVLIETKKTGFQLTAESLESSMAGNGHERKNSCMIINSPNNPTGITYDPNELAKIVKICKENNTTIISDECYSNFSPDKDFSLRKFDDDIIVINSLSKSHAMTGWRIGYAICPSELAVVAGRFLENYIGCPSSISDAAAIVALESQPLNDFTEQRKIVHDWLDANGISYSPSTGGIFIFPDFSSVMARKGIENSFDLATYFLEQAGVAMTPGIAFGENFDAHLRISYCIETEKLKEALNKMETAI